jgi:hypothetical protein
MIQLLGQAIIWAENYSEEQATIDCEVKRRLDKAPRSEHEAIRQYAKTHRDEVYQAGRHFEHKEKTAEYNNLPYLDRLTEDIKLWLMFIVCGGGIGYAIYWFVQTMIYDYHHL